MKNFFILSLCLVSSAQSNCAIPDYSYKKSTEHHSGLYKTKSMYRINQGKYLVIQTTLSHQKNHNTNENLEYFQQLIEEQDCFKKHVEEELKSQLTTTVIETLQLACAEFSHYQPISLILSIKLYTQHGKGSLPLLNETIS